MIGFVNVTGARHRIVRASERPDCPDRDKGKLYADCDPYLRVFLDPTALAVTCKTCLRMNPTEGRS